MARLPDPITEELAVKWPEREEWGKRNNEFNSMIAKAVHKIELEKNRKDEEE